MSIYDMLPKGSQVKCWNCEMETKHVGDSVLCLSFDTSLKDSDYVILLREGGYVKVEDGIITDIREQSNMNYYPEDFSDYLCIDKWGNEVHSYSDLIGQFHGLNGMDDPYYWSEK